MKGFLSSMWKVARRETGLILRRPVYLLGSIGIVVVMALFFHTFFGEGLPQDMPIGVVDSDGSTYSRMLGEELDDTQLGRTVWYDDVHEAFRDLETGRIYGLLTIPKGFNEQVQSFRRPGLDVYVNTSYIIGGALSYKDLVTMVNMANGAVQRQLMRAKGVPDDAIMASIMPISVDAHAIGNPETNYEYYLGNMMIPGVFAMCILLVIVYALGSELKYGTSRHLLRTSDGSFSAAVYGKLLPYTLLFILLGSLIVLTLYCFWGYPLNGSLGCMVLAMIAMVLAYEALGVFLVGLVPNLRLAVCLSCLLSILAFSLAGFTLPAEALPEGVRGLTWIFPLRYYYLIYVREAIYAGGFGLWWQYLLAMLAFGFLPAFVSRRLENAYVNLDYPRN